MNIAGKVFDCYDDPMLKIASSNMDKLSGVHVVDADSLPDNKFALIMKTASGRTIRKYPIDSADSIKLSSVYFAEARKNMHPAIIKTAESGFAGGNNTIDISKLHASDVVSHEYNGYPLHNAEHVKEAVARFDYTAQKMAPKEKYAYAQAIVDRASDLGVMVDGGVLNYLHSDVNPVAVKLGYLARKQELGSRQDLDDLLDNPSPEKFELFDKVAGITGKVPDGYMSCYAWDKIAELDDERIKKIPLQTIEALFDPRFAKEWQTDPVAVYKSLPTPTKTMIDKQAGLNATMENAIPATLAMLAVAAVAKNKGAANVIDKQFEAKGWVKSKDCLYEKSEKKIIRKDGKYLVVDADKHVEQCAKSLPELLEKV